MYVKNAIETEEGSVKFEGELTKEEVAFVVQTGINYLMKVGAIPFTSRNIIPTTAQEQ